MDLLVEYLEFLQKIVFCSQQTIGLYHSYSYYSWFNGMFYPVCILPGGSLLLSVYILMHMQVNMVLHMSIELWPVRECLCHCPVLIAYADILYCCSTLKSFISIQLPS